MKIETCSTLAFTDRKSFKDFQKTITTFDYIDTLMLLQRLSAFLGNQTSVNINLEFEFYNSPRVKHQILLTKDFISFAAKQCILNCSSSQSKCNELDLANLAYQYGIMETDIDNIDSSSGDAWLWILRATNQQWFYLRFPSSIMGRYLYLFQETFKTNSDLKAKVDQILRIEFFDFVKMGICIYSNFCPRPKGFATSFQISSYTNTTIKKLESLFIESNIKKFLEIFSINESQFKIENEKYNIGNDLLKKYEFNLLKRYPIIRTDSSKENEKFIIPSLDNFLYGCFEGVYYILLDKLEKEDQDYLLQGFGSSFEKYIGELMHFYNIEIFSKAKLLDEQSYFVNKKHQVKSSDWLLINDKYIFQIECKKRKLNNCSKAGIEDKNNAGIKTLLKSIAEELDKFPEKEKHIKDNKIKNINYKGQEFINIIVYLDEMFAINKYAKKEIKSKMKNQNNDFYILGCWEFEVLCQYANEEELDFKDALNDLMKDKPQIYKIDFLNKIYKDFFKRIL